ncbi:MAG: hypothetical protein JZU47_13205 [Prolixibacteraceae bacterium]|nr:hypothetical protein [Prolixibacteraceae bacterium]
MKTINISALLILLLLIMNTTAQESASSIEDKSESIIFNGSFGMGTFAAGENLGGSAFVGGSLSADWKPNANAVFSYGLETGLLGGETQGSTIYGIPAVFRLGWYPGFNKNDKIDYFVLLKTGWAFGIWGSHLEKESNPNGIVGGLNFGGRYYLTPLLDVYAELGYNYYGLARSHNHPEYPLGYGSGKIYASVGLSLKLGKH